MSKIGIEYAVFAPATQAAGSITYSEGFYVGPIAVYNSTVSIASGKDYGDDHVVATVNDVTGGTITIEFNHENDDIRTKLLGHTKDTQSAEVSYKGSDVAPYLGTGFVGKSREGNQNVYRAKWYALVQFKEPNDDNSTKGENVTFGHVSVEGDIIIPEGDLEWKKEKSFDTLAAAKAWLNEIADIS